MKKLLKYKNSIAFILGSFLALALPPYYIFIIPFISFSGLLLLLNKAENKKRSFAYGYWFGFGFFAFGFSWIGNALLIEAATFGWLYPITLLACGAFFGLFFAIPAFLSSYFKGITAKAVSFASLYMFFEWTRSFILTGFPWNQIGSMLAFNNNALQLASVMGTYGLTFLVIIISCFPAVYYTNKDKDYTKASILLLITIFGYGYLRTYNINHESSDTTIRIVQPSIPQSMKWDLESLESNFREYIDLSTSEPLDNIDMVIWGETATPFQLDIQPDYLNEITKAVPDDGVLVTGLVRLEFDTLGSYQPLNSMFVIDKQGKIIDYYDKIHLVPFGEYIPLREYLPSWVRPVANAISNFKKGSGHKIININNIPSFGASICYEIIFPSQIVDKNIRPEWVLNLTNDGWYADSSGPRQHLVSTKLRAIEEGLTIVRVANSGISAIISPHGIVINSIELNQRGIIDTALPKNRTVYTLYGEFGNTIPLILCLANILIALILSKKS